MFRRLNTEFGRFIVVGSVNTATTYVIYALLLLVVAYQVAYTIGYVAGIIVSYYLNSRFVFRSTMSLRKALQFPMVYVIQYILGVLLLGFWVATVGVPELLALPLVIVVTIPVTFALSRFIIKDKPITLYQQTELEPLKE